MTKLEIANELSRLLRSASEALSVMLGNDGLVDSDKLAKLLTEGDFNSIYYAISSLGCEISDAIEDSRK